MAMPIVKESCMSLKLSSARLLSHERRIRGLSKELPAHFRAGPSSFRYTGARRTHAQKGCRLHIDVTPLSTWRHRCGSEMVIAIHLYRGRMFVFVPRVEGPILFSCLGPKFHGQQPELCYFCCPFLCHARGMQNQQLPKCLPGDCSCMSIHGYKHGCSVQAHFSGATHLCTCFVDVCRSWGRRLGWLQPPSEHSWHGPMPWFTYG